MLDLFAQMPKDELEYFVDPKALKTRMDRRITPRYDAFNPVSRSVGNHAHDKELMALHSKLVKANEATKMLIMMQVNPSQVLVLKAMQKKKRKMMGLPEED